MIHKQYMDLLNTSPTYIFSYLRNAIAWRGVKAIVDTKNSTSLHPHTSYNKEKELSDPPFAKVQNVINTHEGLFHFNADVHTGREKKKIIVTTTLCRGRYLKKIIQRAIFPTIPHSS